MRCGTHGSGIGSSAADVLEMSVVRGMRAVGGVCVCVWLGAVWEERGDSRIVFGLYQSCGNRESGGCVSVLWWCGWCRWGVGRGLYQGLEGWCYVCMSPDSLCRWQVQVSVNCAM